MKPVLILQHQMPENAAYLTTWLDRHVIPYQIVNAGAGELFPTTIEPYAALAVMGSLCRYMSSLVPFLIIFGVIFILYIFFR